MDVRSDRRYRFALEPDELWPVLARVDEYRRWWPWLRRLDAETFAEGERWRCTVQPPLPYLLRFDLELTEVRAPALAVATVSGDIVGEARLEVTPQDDGCEVRLRSRLAPANALLRGIALVARPVAQLGHDWVLDTGLRQFRTRALPPEGERG